ncbi:uncharacterized protein ARMOST_20322 [Armillaria ostoyae]|uniref:Uncharacterized protein n=1 Tax=Armillaria ostoyae TaxID=47428 RepID=A0A284S711_ARMOS|nr:uncharacterized protein ARMOST_20322 [Armillaria ostoyae]
MSFPLSPPPTGPTSFMLFMTTVHPLAAGVDMARLVVAPLFQVKIFFNKLSAARSDKDCFTTSDT